jgi:hypothetical protein
MTFTPHVVPETRDEFAQWLEEIIVRQQEHVDAILADPDVFILSGLRKVHTSTCPSNGFQRDRREVYHRIGDLDEIRRDIIHGGGPRFPETIIRAELVTMTAKYDRCQTCTPDVPAYVKRTGPATHTDLVEYIEQAASNSHGKPQRAVADVLRLHTKSDGSCTADQNKWPCETVQTIHAVWGVHA